MADIDDVAPRGLPEEGPCDSGCAPMRSLEGRVERLEAGVRTVAIGHSALAQQLAEQTVMLRDQDARIDKHGRRLQVIEAGIEENTYMTRQIRDVVVTGRMMGRFARWLAPTLVAAGISVGVLKGWVADLWSAVGALWHDSGHR